MSFFNFDFGFISSVAGQFTKMAGQTDGIQNMVKNYGPKVQAAWIGGDADEFVADIGRKLMPKFIELALAFTGIQVNLTKSSENVTGADNQAASEANQLADEFSKIY